MNGKFLSALRKLNSNQRRAVEAIDGPVLVLAGPGTGKTQILTLRVANILRQTQMNPYNILCLTFTETATEQMRQRLAGLIGAAAYDVEINTFHGFANSVIRDFPYTFGGSMNDENELEFSNLVMLDDLERLEIIENILASHHWEKIKPFKKSLHFLSEIERLIQDYKRENISPKDLEQATTAELKNLSLIDPTGLKRNEQAKLEIKIGKVKRTIELARLYQYYQQEINRRQRYDYEDMINWVVSGFKNDPELALIYQEKYQYILVDEYQDTNNAQLELLEQLTSFYQDNPNLFVVGDPNQSIYRFQGASDYDVNRFRNLYPKATVISLTHNYRSTQIILDAARKIISGKNIRLVASSQKKGRIEISHFLDLDQEIAAISQKIKRYIGAGIKPQEIAILVRQNNQLGALATACQANNIPFQITKGGDVLGQPLTEKLLTLIEYLLNPSDYVVFGRLIYFFRKYYYLSDINNLIRRKTPISLAAKKFLQRLESTAQKISEQTITGALQTIFDQFNFIRDLAKDSDRLEKLTLLKTIFNLAKDEIGTLDDFVKKLRQRQKYNLSLIAPSLLYGQNQAVTISTVHQAKGTEYRVVFLPQLQDSLWIKKINQNFWQMRLGEDDEDIVAEARRLFYVGLTRAKTNCHLSTVQTMGNRPVAPCRFIYDLSRNIPQATIGLKNKNSAIRQTINILQPLPKLSFKKIESAWLEKTVASQALSPTGFTTYLKCPRDYLWKNIFRVPKTKTVAQAYGTAIHLALEKYFKAFRDSGLKPTASQLAKAYSNALGSELQLTKSEKQEYAIKGKSLLREYYQKNQFDFTAPIWTEYNFGSHNVHLDKIPLAGKVDKIEWVDRQHKTVRVIDYKTGQVKSRNALFGQTKANDTDYLYQLKFYWLLAQLDHRFYLKWKIAETRLEFLDEGRRFTKVAFAFEPAEIEQLKKEIKQVWSNIQALKFDHNPNNKYGCEYCELFE